MYFPNRDCFGVVCKIHRTLALFRGDYENDPIWEQYIKGYGYGYGLLLWFNPCQGDYSTCFAPGWVPDAEVMDNSYVRPLYISGPVRLQRRLHVVLLQHWALVPDHRGRKTNEQCKWSTVMEIIG